MDVEHANVIISIRNFRCGNMELEFDHQFT